MKPITYLLLIITILISCSKNTTSNDTDPIAVGEDTSAVLLKDMISERLPSPYYHFEYNNKNYVTAISFASGLDLYNVQYDHNRVKRMLNTRNDNHMEYAYSNNMVSLITESSGKTGEKSWEYSFNYNNNNRLAQIKWLRFLQNGITSRPYRKIILTYYDDGNLARLDDYFADSSGVLLWSSNQMFKDYDSSINVDDFSLFKNFFETFLFLPSVKLQRNNPGTAIITGKQNDYTINYRYQFQNGLPVLKTGTVRGTRGTDSAKIFNIRSSFSYY